MAPIKRKRKKETFVGKNETENKRKSNEEGKK